MKNKILKIITAIMLLTTLTMSNFCYVGASLISYAADNVEVEFSTNLKDEKTLVMQIDVDKEGYFNGTIALGSSNFKFKNSNNKYIYEMNEKTITLNQINAGETAEFEVEIEPIKNDLFNIGLLSMESKLSLTGIYKNNKEKDINIEKTVKLEFSENSSEQNIENSIEIITNKVLKISGTEKRVVQLSLNMGLKDNNYPINNINSKITIPVINGKQAEVLLSEKLNNMTAYNYKYENATLDVNMKNEPNSVNEVMWKKSGNENLVLTLIYDKDAKIEETKVDIQTTIELYNSKKLTANTSVDLNLVEVDSVIQTTIINSENSIFKGKLYSGINREYETTTKIDVNLIGVAKYVEVAENASTYVVDGANVDANVYYAQTKINKEELLKVLGENGQLTITNIDGTQLAKVGANTATDEQGNIIITYTNKVKGINIKTTEPKNLGSIEIKHIKTIEKTEKEIVKQAEEISTNLTQKYNVSEELEETYSKGIEVQKEQKIELKETSTQATISMNKNSLSTLSANNVEISAILKSSTEENDLFKNPKLQIILPQEIESVKVNTINKIYADEFEFKTPSLTDEPGIGKVITIELEGEQTNYLNEVSEGIQIVINADITFSKITPSTKSNIIMKYKNENGAQAEYETQEEIDIVSQYGVLVYSKVTGFNKQETVLESIEDGKLQGKLDINEESERIVTIERHIINNYEEKIENINIVGNLEGTLNSSLQEITTNVENSNISYGEDITTAKEYKVELPNGVLEPGQVATVTYKIKIPAGIKYNENMLEKLNVSYQYKEQTISKDYETYLATITIANRETIVKTEQIEGIGNLIITSTSGEQQLKDGQEIFEGQTVNNVLTLVNETKNDLKNVKIIVKQQNGIFYTEKVTQEMNTQTLEPMDVTRIVEDETLEQKEFTVEEIKSGETVSYEYQFSVKEKQGEETKGIVSIEADGFEKQEITTMTNKIKEAKLKLNIKCNYNEERTVLAGSVYPITLTAKNISEEELKDVVLELKLPEGTSFDEKYLVLEDNFTYVGTENGVVKLKINSIPAGETVDIILSLVVEDFEEDTVNLNATIRTTIDNETYVSNEINREAIQQKAKISVVQKGNQNITTIKTGDQVIYTTTIKNSSARSNNIEIIDHVPTAAVVTKAYIVKGGKTTIINNITENDIKFETELDEKEEITFVVETAIDENLAQESEITNIVEVNAYSQYIKSNAITYKLANIVDQDPTGGDSENSNNTISGKIWLDSNRNGQIDEEETLFKNMEVKLLNATTGEIARDINNNEIKVKTDDNGKYVFTNLPNDKYIVVIEFDTTNYSLTEYKKAGISEEINSDVITKTLNGKNVAMTDEIEIKDNNIRNVNAGLIENKVFDLRLDKYINRITVQNSAGTKVMEYSNTQLAKVEIDAKQINNTTVIVEYAIEITNEGEVPGYANEIVDYMPNDFKFSSEINPSWYSTTEGNKLHNISLTNEVINPGETKTITLALVKTLNDNNTGTTVNTAEIAKSSNHLLINDKDSTPGNNAKKEDDISTAELIISIRTGAGIAITITIIIAIAILVTVAIILKKRRGENE